MQKKVLTIALALGLVFNYLASNKTKSKFAAANEPSIAKPLCFTENKGQITNQLYQARPDVIFVGQNQGLTFHLRNNGISYQLSRIDSYKKDDFLKGASKKFKQKLADQKTIYRVDINWLNANKNCEVISNHKLDAADIYYVNNQSQTVNSFEEVIYKNLYNKIDLKWYEKNGELKYDYICQAGADYASIKLNIEGSQQLSINKNGELEIKTPLGTIIEKAPLVLQNGQTIKSNWVLKNNVLSFNIENLNTSLPYIIDPAVRAWGTYYGGSGFENNSGCVTDASGNIYISGFTDSGTSIATSGAHQTTISVFTDAFLTKFTSNGVRLWSTYYGSIDTDIGYSVATFSTNAVYLAGSSSSSINISTSGAHQVSPGSTNNSDAFLVKFDGNGSRQWATYYGGSGFDEGYSCSTDLLGNVYLTGGTDAASGTVIATSGSHQTTNGGSFNAFIAKFNSSGVRQWATYYGGSSSEFGFASCTDVSNNVYLYGLATSSNVTMVSSGCHQSTKAGFQDAFLVKFNSSGVRQWATFYGGTGDEFGYGCATNINSDVYICGTTNSTIGIVTAACHQSVNINGFNDGFLVKFNASGVRQWGTFYGGEDNDDSRSCAVDPSGDVYLCGTTASTLSSNIATSGSQQTSLLGGAFSSNAFLARFTSAGVRVSGTYYGSDGGTGNACTSNSAGIVYLAGSTSATLSSIISTSGAHQTSNGGNTDAFLAKFIDCTSASTPTNTTSLTNQTICSGQSATLSVTSGTNTTNWFATLTSTNILGTGNNYTTPTLSTGTYTYYAEASSSCGASLRTGITLTVNQSPSITVNNGTICAGQNFTITPTGATNYTINGNAANTAIVNPGVNSNYTVIGANGSCLSLNTATCFVTITSSPTVSVNSGTICVGQNFVIVPSGANSYTIQGGTATVSPASSTNYTVIGASVSGCLSQNIVTSSLTVRPNPTISVNSGSICSGDVFTITPSGANTYTVQGGSITVSPNSNTTYTVIGTSTAGCISQTFATASVSVSTSPTITANNGSICAGQSFTIIPSGASNYSIFPGPNFIVNPVNTTTYIIASSNAQGCLSNILTVSISVSPTPIVTVNSGSICSGQSFVINPSGASNYIIQGGSYNVSPIVTTTYNIIGSNASNCSQTVVCTVSVNATPTISVNNGTVCSGSTFTIPASGAFTYTYQGGSNIVTPTSNSSYTVIGKSAAGCLAQNIATCNITVLLTPTISASNGTVCAGQSFTVVPAGAATYTLLNSFGTTINIPGNFVISPVVTSNYYVSGTAANGCVANFLNYASFTVTANSPSITVNSGTICSGNSFTINPSGALTYTIQGGSNVVSPTSNTNYTIAGTDALGCAGQTTVSVVINEGTEISSKPYAGGSVCRGSSYTFTLSGGISYTFSSKEDISYIVNGSVAVVSPSITSSYSVIGKNSFGCLSKNYILVYVGIKNPPTNPFPSTVTAPAQGYNDTYFGKGDSYEILPKYGGVINSLNGSFNPYYITVNYHANAITIYTINNISSSCPVAYTLQVNGSPTPPEEDLTKDWKIPNYVSPNEDFSNDVWYPERGNNNLSAYFFSITSGGVDPPPRLPIKHLKIASFVKVYVDRDVRYDGDAVWDPKNEGFKKGDWVVYDITLTNGKHLTGVISIDPSPSSKTK